MQPGHQHRPGPPGLVAMLLAVLLVSGFSVWAPAAAAAPDPGADGQVDSSRAAVDALRRAVDAAGSELAAATQAWEQGQGRLDELRQREYASSTAAEVQDQRLQQLQGQLDALARAAYQRPSSPAVTAVLRGDLQALSTFAYLKGALDRSGRSGTVDVASVAAARSKARDLTARRAADRRQAQQLQAELDSDLTRLQDLASRRAAELQAASDDLARAEAAAAERRAAAAAAAAAAAVSPAPATGGWVSFGPAGSPCSQPVSADVVNGFLGPAALCSLSVAGNRLAVGAAQDFEAMNAAYRQQFGTPMCLTESYRDYAGQVAVFTRTPSLAAVPGRSLHGLGRAVDLCGGVQLTGSPQHLWMTTNAVRFGFALPAWAQPNGRLPEPWHWEWSR